MHHILGIRHHGTGSAKRVLQRLQELKPDLVLVEGPPEIDELIQMAGHEDFKPPVAIMLYNETDPNQSTFYPYAAYSPEWVAIKYALDAGIPVKAIDLPAKLSFNQKQLRLLALQTDNETNNNPTENRPMALSPRRDPMSYLAEIAGFKDSEQWWEYQFENKVTQESAADHFDAVMIAVTALREQNIESSLDAENIFREAYMRTLIRKAEQELYQNIAVICGAWHGPALVELKESNKPDTKLLKLIPKSKIKINASWIPWTNSRLSLFSGYGAGIMSPGWSEHKWAHKEAQEIKWLTRIAELFREEGRDISTAHVLESYKLATALCSLRSKAHVNIEELNEATLTVMCMGNPIYLELIKEKLIVGNKIGGVPEDIPKVPLQQDFEKQCKTLRLKMSEIEKEIQLDLRKKLDLQRSVFFNRLELLEVPWAKRTSIRTKGTFKEGWVLEWEPEMMIALIEKSYLGNTVHDAVMHLLQNKCKDTKLISELSGLIQTAIAAELEEGIDLLLNRIDALSSISTDIIDLMKAMPDLVSLSRYGNVRKSDLKIVDQIVQRFFTKIFIGLPNACYGLDEESSLELFELMSRLSKVVKINDDEATLAAWNSTLLVILDKQGIHDIIQGCTCRMLLDNEILSQEEASTKISYALSLSRDPHEVASWVEGFLKGNGMILIYDDRLWNLLYNWTSSLEKEVFELILPYLRRAFSKFEPSERKQIGQKAKKGLVTLDNATAVETTANWDEATALLAYETLDYLMGNTSNNG
jgi:hypothetical protein